MKTTKILLAFSLLFLAFGCSKSDNPVINNLISADEVAINSKLDVANDDISKITEDQLTNAEGFSNRNENSAQSFLPACATVTTTPADLSQITVGTLITKTIDFGTEGCTIPQTGNVLKGKIILSTEFHPTATSHVVNCTFENFYHNNRLIAGTKTFTRTMTTETATSPSHPIWNMTMNLTITLPDFRVLTRTGSRTSEIITGYDTPLNFGDNIYSVTGSWTTTFPNQNVQVSTITSPLIVKLPCLPTNSPMAQGILSIVRGDNVGSLDYGNGTCDKIAIFTYNGYPIPITLGN